MADKAEDKGSDVAGEKHVAYKLLAPFGEQPEGSVVYLTEDVGDALVALGKVALASPEDMAQEDAEEPVVEEEAPMIANAIGRLSEKVEQAVTGSVAKALERTSKPASSKISIPAQVAEPIYKSTGHMIRGVMKAMVKGDKSEWNRVDAYQADCARKLGVQHKSILGINETTNSQGGYLVNPQFSPDVFTIQHNQLDLAAQCDQIEATSNVYNQRFVNESSLANGSIFGGLNMVAVGEGASFTSSLPAWSNVTLTLNKLAVFNYYTSEVLEDASYPIESELNEYVAKAFLYGINTQIIQGSTLEGALNCPSLVTVTSSSNDTAYHTAPGTALTYADLASMWSAVYPDSQTSPKGMWLFHPSLAASLTQMTYTFSGSNPAWGIQYNAENGLSGQGAMTPYRIFGKPAYPHWACSAPGVAGDILYIDFATFKHYRRPFRVEISRDFQFGVDQIAVRYCSRIDVRSIFRQKVTGVNGSQQFSNIVCRSGTGT